jgi:DNA-binding transcriptional ArsR family regulator
LFPAKRRRPEYSHRRAVWRRGFGSEIDVGFYFDNTQNMELSAAAVRLAALGHETRLAIFRLLVQAGPEGVNAGLIGERLGIAPATLSFHLAHLSRVGLIRGRQKGRFIFYAADYATMDELIAYLTDNCCQGGQCLPRTAAVSTTAKHRRKTNATEENCS